ncbi:MAG: Crp/Fnr family transcriptional regulator [Desulfovibrionaceae bacterium]|nr:Crp/Fnr family transcriptional regulator [Desulfovibrionaceae bacterium]
MTETGLSPGTALDMVTACFPELDRAEAMRLARVSRRYTYRKNEWLFAEGTQDVPAHWLLCGSVALLKGSMSGRNTILHVVRPGHFIDHCMLFPSRTTCVHAHGQRTVVSALALSRCETLRLDAEVLRSVLAGSPSLAMRLLRSLAARQRMFINKISVSQGKISSRRRVASWLLHKARVEKSLVLDDDITREVQAGLLGLSRESLSRQLGCFVQEGCIRLERKRIVIVDEGALRACLDR